MEKRIENAVIRNAEILMERGFLTYMIDLDFGGTSQSFGGYSMTGGGFSAAILRGMMEIGGVTEWSKLKGRPVRAESVGGRILRLGHFIENKWILAREHSLT